MTFGFQSFDEQGVLLFDSNYNGFRMLGEGSVAVSMNGSNSMYSIPTSLNASGRTWTFMRPPTGCFITKMNVQRSGLTNCQCFNGETLALGSGSGFGASAWQNFVRGAVSTGNSGMQTFDENGVLTYDSNSRQLVMSKICYPDAWALHSSRQNAVDPAYTDYYYSIPVPVDSFYILEEADVDGFNVTPVRVGFRASFGRGVLFAAYSTRNGASAPARPTVVIGFSAGTYS